MDVSQRKSERLRNQALKAEERKAKEEKLNLQREQQKRHQTARSARSAQTKKQQQQQVLKEQQKNTQQVGSAASGKLKKDVQDGKVTKKTPKQLVKLKYAKVVEMPEFEPVSVKNEQTLWLKLEIREFLIRFDKICKVPKRFLTVLNDVLEPWTFEVYKSVVLSMLRLLRDDKKGDSSLQECINEVESSDEEGRDLFTALNEYIRERGLSGYPSSAHKDTPNDGDAPDDIDIPTLHLIRQLMLLCLSTEAVRLTIHTDMDQIKLVERDAHDEIKQINLKLKETEQKLAALKKVDKQVSQEKVANAQRAAQNKISRVEQQLFGNVHKYNMRTLPVADDGRGNQFWSFQYKSAAQPGWGGCIFCVLNYRFDLENSWADNLVVNVSHTLEERDRLITERDLERKLNKSKTKDGKDSKESKFKRKKYPKVDISKPKLECETMYCLIKGKEDIMRLGKWLESQPQFTVYTNLNDIAKYLAEDV